LIVFRLLLFKSGEFVPSPSVSSKAVEQIPTAASKTKLCVDNPPLGKPLNVIFIDVENVEGGVEGGVENIEVGVENVEGGEGGGE